MADLISCPSCGKPVDPGLGQCPHCAADLTGAGSVSPTESERKPEHGPGQPLAPEMLVPRLGEYLLEVGVLLPEDLQQALDLQQKSAAQGSPILLGSALLELKLIDREILDQVITKQLVTLQTALRDTNRQLEQRVRQRTQDLDRRLVQIRTAAELTQFASTAASLSVLLKRAVDLIAERFGYSLVSIFLLDANSNQAVLEETSGAMSEKVKARGLRVPAGAQSIIGWVLENNQPRMAGDVRSDPFYLKDELLPDILSEAAVPIAMGENILGALDVQHTTPNAFDSDAVAVLLTLANHLAAIIQNVRLIENTQNSLSIISSLYEASHRIAQAASSEQVMEAALRSLRQAPFLTAYLQARQKVYHVVSVFDGETGAGLANEITDQFPATAPASVQDAKRIFSSREPVLLHSPAEAGEYPELLLSQLYAHGCQSLALIPILVNESPEAVILIGSRHPGALTQGSLQPYASLAELTATAIEKVQALQKVEKRLTALQSLNTISQAVSVQTDLYALYQSVHQEVRQIMGDVNFLIAIYEPISNQINIPYMYDKKEIRTVDPFPVGEGLTSILLRTRQPLLLVEDTERKSREMGAKLVGAPARSWLGVPLLVGGEAIGAVIVQDLEQEFRFDEDDQRLLSTLASQVAAAIRNARLLERTHRQAERERQLYEITSKIRSSTDMRAILAITAQELGKAFSARRARIEIHPAEEDSTP